MSVANNTISIIFEHLPVEVGYKHVSRDDGPNYSSYHVTDCVACDHEGLELTVSVVVAV
jgi:hypothetical protein